jgi:hypothetical protein
MPPDRCLVVVGIGVVVGDGSGSLGEFDPVAEPVQLGDGAAFGAVGVELVEEVTAEVVVDIRCG